MRTKKATPSKKRVKDLDAKRAARVTGGRQTVKTDFGAILGQGASKVADEPTRPPS
jgi:hypothetical protein